MAELRLYILYLFVLYVILALWPPALQCQLPALLFVCVLFVSFLLFVVVLSGEPGQNQGRGLVDRKLVQAPPPPPPPPPVILLLAFPRRLFCFWFFGGFRYGVSLFIVILAIY